MAWEYRPAQECFQQISALWDDCNRANYDHVLLDSRFVGASLHWLGGEEVLLGTNTSSASRGVVLLKKSGPGQWETFQPSQAPLGFIVVDKSIEPREVLLEILSSLPGSALQLSILQQDPNCSSFGSLSDDPQVEQFEYIRTPNLPLEGTYEEYWASRSGNLRHNVSRQLKRLAEKGRVLELMVRRTPAEMESAIHEYGMLEAAGWKGREGTAVTADNSQGRFYHEILKAFCATGQAIVYQLVLDGKVVASDLCLTHGSMIVVLKTAYDESIPQTSPALLMRQMIISQLYRDKNIQVVEFYGRVLDWHLKWTDQSPEHVSSQLLPESPRRRNSRRCETLGLISMTRKFQVPQEPRFSRDFFSFRNNPDQAIPAAKESRRFSLNWARNGIYHSLTAMKLLSGDAVLVPSYVCKTVPEAIHGFGARVVYYRVSKDCRIDFADLESRLDSRSRALIAVHYFGFPQLASDLRNFCDRHGLYFVEDCAHVLRSESEGKPLGSYGDASVFSLRKFLPLFDGAELILNRSQDELEIPWAAESLLYTLKSAKDLLDQWIGHSSNPALRIPFQYMSSLARLFAGLKSRPGSRALAVEKTDATFDLQLVGSPMSRLARMVYNHSDIPLVVRRRIANYQVLQRELLPVPGIRFLSSELPVGICPWVFPVIFNETPDACTALREQGIPARNWQGVRPTDLPQDAFPDSDFLYRNLVFLPVHQDLRATQMSQIAKAVKNVLRGQAAD